jgi:hypothetical protein
VPERRGHIRAIAAEVPRIAATALGKRGFGEAQLVTQWEAIIGADFAEKLSPERLNFQRGERSEGTLRLRVASAFAIEAQHLEPMLVERINGFFGYRAVARIVLVQGPPRHAATRAVLPRALSANEERHLDERLASVPDSDLREALKRLGAAVMGSKKP